MGRTIQEIFQDAAELPNGERAELAGMLIESLDCEPDPDAEAAWARKSRSEHGWSGQANCSRLSLAPKAAFLRPRAHLHGRHESLEHPQRKVHPSERRGGLDPRHSAAHALERLAGDGDAFVHAVLL
jgi:Putative addiction module component